MTKDDITLQIGIDAKDAIRGVTSFGKAFSKSLSAISKSVFSVQGAIVGLGAAFASAGVANAIGTITQAASRQEDAINSLNTALAISGEFSKEASQDFQDYASAIQSVTTVGDEAVLEQLALVKAFGATNEQAKDLTTASIELAAAQGKSLEEATRQVAKTLGGYAGELGEVIPAIKELTSDQLKAGAAAELLIKQFGGSAAAQVNTFSGAIAQTSNLFGDLQESLGATITQNPAVIGAIKVVGDTFKSLISIVEANQGAIAKFVSSFVKGFAKSLPSVVDVVGFVAKSFQGLLNVFDTVKIAVAQLGRAFLSFDIVQTIVANLNNVFAALESAALEAFEAILKGVEGVLGFASKFLPEFEGTLEGIKTFREGITQEIEDIADAASENLIDPNKAVEGLNEIEQTALESAGKTNEFFAGIQAGIGVLREAAESASDSIQGLGDGLQAPAAPKNVEKSGESLGDSFATKAKEGLEEGTELLFKGAEGARIAVVKGIQAGIAAKFGPVAGQVAGPILDALTRGPEFVESAITGFVEALPMIFDNIAQALPVLVETLAENIDEIVIAIAKASPAIARALFIEVPNVLSNPALWADVASALVQAVAEEITGVRFEFSNEKLRLILDNFGKSFNQGLNNFGEAFFRPFRPLIDAINKLSASIPSLGGGGGGAVGGAVSGIRSAIGLQDGGLIPGGFPNDTFPANLSSGELVVPRDEVQAFQRRDQEVQISMEETNALLAQIAGQRGGSGNISIELDGETLFDAILDGSRRNERLTA